MRKNENVSSTDLDPIAWLVLVGERTVVAGVMLVVLFSIFLAFQIAGVITIRNVQAITTVFGNLIVGNITLITIIVSIDQLVLSRELKNPGQARDQIQNMTEYRQHIEEITGREELPLAPLDFLHVLLSSTRQQAQSLDESIAEERDRQLRASVTELVTTVTDHVDHVEDLMDRSNEQPSTVLLTVLTMNYAKPIHRIRHIQGQYRTDLSDAETDVLEGIVDRLEEIDSGRQYFKTFYVQEELAYLSRVLLYIGLVAEIVSVAMVFAVSSPHAPALFRTVPDIVLPAALTIGFAPIVILFAFILRIATVSEQTTSLVAFSRPEVEE